MREHEKEKILRRYSDRLKEFGVSAKTLGWDKERHFLRYHVLLSEWELNGNTILDFGCGFGYMYSYIKEKAIKLNYNGVDINPDLINEGKALYPEVEFYAIDFLKEGSQKYDYIFSSGVHNFKLEDNWEFIERTFNKFCQSAKKGFALNFISDNVDSEYKKEHLYYTNPAQVLELAYKYSRRVVLRNDYMPFEFSVFVDLRDDFDNTKVIYPEYKRFLK